MIRIVTIEREYGCGGGEIARQVAERLGWKLWDQALTCEIARLSHCDQAEVERREERRDPLYYRLFKLFLRGSFEGSLNLQRMQLLDAESIMCRTKEAVEKAASSGNCVIVGRGSQHFLRDRGDVLRVFLFAPKEEKVRRLQAQGISQADAEELVDAVDKERATFIEKYFHVEWPNRSLYHALLNTTSGDEPVVRTILDLRQELDRREG